MKTRTWCLVLLAICVGCNKGENASQRADTAAPSYAAPPDAASPVVYLDKSLEFFSQTQYGPDWGLLTREAFRQALLLAAREELGLATRDAWLGDAMPGEGSIRPFDIATRKGEVPQVEIRRGFPPAMSVVGVLEPPSVSAEERYKRLFMATENLSRTGFLEVLKREYGARSSRAWKPDAQVPREVEDSLREMSFLAQFRAVRQVHDLMASQGESPALLGALVRGYANLGLQTEFHWHPAHKVFKARSILYAQRWLTRQPDSLPAIWHRAYALTLAGAHVDALSDLEAARKGCQAIAEKERPQPPPWAGLLEACCRYDVEKLAAELDHKEHGQLATLLWYDTIELAGSQRWTQKSALEALKRIPQCFRVHDGMCEFGGVAMGNTATAAPFLVLGRTLYGRVREMPGLPETVRQACSQPSSEADLSAFFVSGKPEGMSKEIQARARLMAALREASRPKTAAGPEPKAEAEGRGPAAPGAAPGTRPSDGGEPSWAALALLIQDLSFQHVWRRVAFQRYMLSSSADDFLGLTAPLVAGHPLRLFLEACAWDVSKQRAAIEKAAHLKPDGLEIDAMAILRGLAAYDRSAGNAILQDMLRHHDALARDLAIMSRYLFADPMAGSVFPGMLLQASPYSPLARALLVQTGRLGPPQIAECEQFAVKQPALAEALARYYAGAQRWDDSIRCCQMAIKVVDDLNVYRTLANAYLGKGDEGRWLKTLEQALKLPDYGSDHSSIQQQIAAHFMDKRQWKRALPYAEAAAQSGSASGLGCAARCYEGLQDWTKAEQCVRTAAERHRESSFEWYYFCRRTGKGDLQAARKLAKRRAEDPSTKSTPVLNDELAKFWLLEGKLDLALPACREIFARDCDPLWGLLTALVADELKDAKTRDEALQTVRTRAAEFLGKYRGRPRAELIPVAALIDRDLAQGGKGDLDLKAVDELRKPATNGYATAYVDLIVARYLQSHGKREEAIRRFKQCLAIPDAHPLAHTLAGAALLDLGVKPEVAEEGAKSGKGGK